MISGPGFINKSQIFPQLKFRPIRSLEIEDFMKNSDFEEIINLRFFFMKSKSDVCIRQESGLFRILIRQVLQC